MEIKLVVLGSAAMYDDDGNFPADPSTLSLLLSTSGLNGRFRTSKVPCPPRRVGFYGVDYEANEITVQRI
jgi:hypothetical protein